MTDLSGDDAMLDGHEPDYRALPEANRRLLLISISIVALCGIVYELIIGAVSSYLLGDSVYQFSITIGVFMFAMGIGSWISQYIRKDLIEAFVITELLLAFIGGVCSLALFLAFPLSPPLYRAVMLAFILVIGTLVGLEIPLLTRILAQSRGTRKSIANVMSLDYIGALIGSVCFPLLLVPHLGLMRASFAVGLINAVVALATIVGLRAVIKRQFLLLCVAIGLILGLFILVLSGSRLNAFAQSHLYFDDIIWKKQSAYQSLTITQNPRLKDFRLYIDGHLQFSESDEHRYHESLVHPVMGFEGKRERILILGGGDGLAVRELLNYPEISHIDLVDLDPAITDLATDFAPLVRLNGDSLADARVKVYNADAFVFVNQDGPKYDRIIIDMPDPHDATLSKLYSVEFYHMISKRMAPDAVLVTQASSPFFAHRTYWSIAETLGAVFPNIQSFTISLPSFGIWGFHLAGPSPAVLETPAMPEFPTQFWNPAVHEAARVFPPDIGRPEGLEVNSIFTPTLYQTYLNDLRDR